MRLRVLTFNIQNGERDRDRAELVNRELRRLAPDLLALQEVAYPAESDQLGGLLAGTGLHGTHQAAVLRYQPEFADRYGGTAVATRWPHRVLEVVDPRQADAADVPWCTLAVAVSVPELGDLLFIATTASWRPGSEWSRERQAIGLVDLDARHRTSLPTVIAGDLNAAPEAASVRYLSGLQSLQGRSTHYRDAWAAAGDGPGHTWSADNPRAAAEIAQLIGHPGYRARIDYVFIGSPMAHPGGRAGVVAARLVADQPVDGTWLSDHAGVLVDLEVQALAAD